MNMDDYLNADGSVGSSGVQPSQYFEKGKEYFSQKKYIPAMEYFQAAVAEYPDRENAYLKLSETYMAMGRQKDAAAVLYKLLSLQPDNSTAQKMLVQYQNPQTVERPIIRHNNVTQTTKSTKNGNQSFSVNGVSFKMVYVAGGTFTMGATSEQGGDADNEENPAHYVTLSNYYIGETEVTQALWKAVMGSNPSFRKGVALPVEQVSWDDCQEFVRRLNVRTGRHFRLPTEAEWEYAARGGSKSRGFKYSGSNNLDEVAWHKDNSGKKTHPVARKRPNELGLYDMSGNVWEWCSDWYGSYSNSAQTNPTGPNTGSDRVRRGGSWSYNAWFCRVSDRYFNYPSFRYYCLGFRLVLVP